MKFDNWMDGTGKDKQGNDRPRWQLWEDHQIKMGAKRQMMTWVLGEAWEEYCGTKYRTHRKCAFLKTGLLLGPATTENENQIYWEGMEDICPVRT